MGNDSSRPSLEALLESGGLSLDILHPGGLEITGELAELCNISRGSKVLDVASGTGESACYLAETFGCQVVGVDISDSMVQAARKKAKDRNLDVIFEKADALHLPFHDDTFDAVLSECTLCLLDKEKAMGEMARTAKPGGYVGMNDISWAEDTPETLKRQLAEIEGERPETRQGWRILFETTGLVDVRTVDKSHVISSWARDIRSRLGFTGLMKIAYEVIRRWGISGLNNILRSARIFESRYTGYAMIVGRKEMPGRKSM